MLLAYVDNTFDRGTKINIIDSVLDHFLLYFPVAASKLYGD